MDGQALYDLTTTLLDGEQIDQDEFLSLLNLSRVRREQERPWVVLRREDQTLSTSPSDTYLTQKTLPTDFKRFYGLTPVQLVNGAGRLIFKKKQIPIDKKLEYQFTPTKFYIDYSTKKLYLCGSINEVATLHLYYICKQADITLATEWGSFDEVWHKILAYDVAIYHQLGIDYDIVNNVKGNNLAKVVEGFANAMREEDDDIQNSMQDGVDYGTGDVFIGGRVPQDEFSGY
jgi:hypothetical protein